MRTRGATSYSSCLTAAIDGGILVAPGVASLGLLRLCFAKLLASLVGQPDAFGAGESRDATKRAWSGQLPSHYTFAFLALPIWLIHCDSCECPSRSDGPPAFATAQLLQWAYRSGGCVAPRRNGEWGGRVASRAADRRKEAQERQIGFQILRLAVSPLRTG